LQFQFRDVCSNLRSMVKLKPVDSLASSVYT